MSNEMQKYNPGNTNMLVPTVHFQQVSPWHRAQVSEVRVSSDPNSGDVYKVGSKQENGRYVDSYCLAKPALYRIAAAAGISWVQGECKPLKLEREYVCYQAVCSLRLPDGTSTRLTGTKEIDLDVIREELLEQYTAKAGKGLTKDAAQGYVGKWVNEDGKNRFYLDESEKARWIQTQVSSNVIQWKKHKLGRAETGAMLRAIRVALAIKQQYTAEELARPFVVPRIDFTPDYSDPQVRQAFLEQGTRSMASLYAAPPHSVPALPPPSHSFDDDEEMDYTIIHQPQAALPPASVEVMDDQPQNIAQPPARNLAQPSDTQREASATPPAQPPLPQKPAGTNGKTSCAGCSAVVTQKVAEFSHRKYGQPLCMDCQGKKVAA